MKRFKAVAILVMFAGIILLLQACTPKNGAPTPIDAEETFSRLLKEVHYAAELEDASEYSEYILNGLPNDVEVRMYLCGGGRRRTHHVQSEQRLAAARNSCRA